jgi:hypothetical protein
MTKFLRYAEIRGFLRCRTPVSADERPPNRLQYCTGCPNWFTGAAMYFRTALPVECADVAKLNIYGCADSSTVCDEAVLGIANVWVNVPPEPADILVDCRAQQAFALDLAHTAIQTAAERFSFQLDSFVAAKALVEKDDYVLRYQIGKTRKSADRKYAASVWCHFDSHFKTELIVLNSAGGEHCRYQFATGDETSIGQLLWQGNDRVHVPLTSVTGDAYWDCSLDGTFSFKFPKSDDGSAHHLYQHATMLLDGTWVLPDKHAGMQLLQRAADAGYKHAIRRLQLIIDNC